MLKYLTSEEMEDKAAAGKVGFEANYNGRPAAETEAIINALQSYEDGIFRIFLTMRNLRIILLRPTERRIYTYLYPADNAVRKTLVTAI